MKTLTLKKSLIFWTAAFVAGASAVRAEDTVQRNRYEVFISPFLSYGSFRGGDFDGTRGLFNATETLAVPQADNAAGLGGSLGFRIGFRTLPLDLALDFNLAGSRPSIHSGALSGDGSLGVFGFDVKVFFRPGKRIQPFLLGGFNAVTLTAENFAFRAGGRSDAKFYGGGGEVGGGAAFYLNKWVSIDPSIRHRWLSFDEAEGFTPRAKIDKDLKATQVQGQLAVTLHWGFPMSEAGAAQ